MEPGLHQWRVVSGEWAARARDIRKRDLVLECVAQTRAPEQVPDYWLCCAPIRKGRIDLIAEKACELGVAKLQPVLTRRAVVDKLNLDRLHAHLVEAAEQCGRTALPELVEPVKLAAMLKDWPAERALFFADETGGAPALEAMREHRGPAAILIGPEGGFDADERDARQRVFRRQRLSPRRPIGGEQQQGQRRGDASRTRERP